MRSRRRRRPEVEDVIPAIGSLLAGQQDDLAWVRLDMAGVPEFHRRVYDVARAIPPGATLSYGEVARGGSGSPGAAQAVGRALGRNPFPIVVRATVSAADGALRGFSAPGGVETKRRMLALEGAGAPTLFD